MSERKPDSLKPLDRLSGDPGEFAKDSEVRSALYSTDADLDEALFSTVRPTLGLGECGGRVLPNPAQR